MKLGATEERSRFAYRDVLRHPSFRNLWFGQICSQFAINTLIFVLALRVYQTTTSNAAVSALFLFYSIPAVLFGLVAGTVVDRLDKRRVLVTCDILRGLFVMALLFSSHQIFVVYVLTLANSIITQFYVPSEAPLIPKFVPKSFVVSANSMFSFTFYSSLAVGSILAGPFLRWFGQQGAFVVLGLLFWLAAYFSSRIPSQREGTVGIRQVLAADAAYLVSRIWVRLIEGVRYVRSSASLFDAIMLLTGTQVIFAILGTLGPGFADRVLAIDVRDASLLIIGPVVVGVVVGALWVGSVGFRFGAVKLIRFGVVSVGVLLVVIAGAVRVLRMPALSRLFSQNITTAIVVFLTFLLGVANSFLDVPANAQLQQKAKGALRGRVYGMLGAFVGGVGVLPVMLGGVLADAIGVGKVIFLLGVSVSLYGAYRIRYNRI